MRSRSAVCTIGLMAAAALQLAGCTSPAPRRVSVPPRDQAKDYGRVHEYEPLKPLPEQAERSPGLPRPYDDVPLVSQRPPEQRAYVEAYERVGRPHLMIVATPADRAPNDTGNVDYAALETVLADWLSADGKVSLIAPSANPPPRPTTGSAGEEPTTPRPPDADVLVRVQVHATQVGKDVGEHRLIAEAINTRGGESIGRAVVDVGTQVDKSALNEATRFIARKLMDEMTESWNRLANGPRAPQPAASQTPPNPPLAPSRTSPSEIPAPAQPAPSQPAPNALPAPPAELPPPAPAPTAPAPTTTRP